MPIVSTNKDKKQILSASQPQNIKESKLPLKKAARNLDDEQIQKFLKRMGPNFQSNYYFYNGKESDKKDNPYNLINDERVKQAKDRNQFIWRKQQYSVKGNPSYTSDEILSSSLYSKTFSNNKGVNNNSSSVNNFLQEVHPLTQIFDLMKQPSPEVLKQLIHRNDFESKLNLCILFTNHEDLHSLLTCCLQALRGRIIDIKQIIELNYGKDVQSSNNSVNQNVTKDFRKIYGNKGTLQLLGQCLQLPSNPLPQPKMPSKQQFAYLISKVSSMKLRNSTLQAQISSLKAAIANLMPRYVCNNDLKAEEISRLTSKIHVTKRNLETKIKKCKASIKNKTIDGDKLYPFEYDIERNPDNKDRCPFVFKEISCGSYQNAAINSNISFWDDQIPQKTTDSPTLESFNQEIKKQEQQKKQKAQRKKDQELRRIMEISAKGVLIIQKQIEELKYGILELTELKNFDESNKFWRDQNSNRKQLQLPF